MKRKFLSIVLCLSMLLSLLTLASCSDKNNPPDGSGTNPPAAGAESIAILYENDVHCAVDGYSKLASMKSELKSSYDHVGVVSSGDFVQGGTLGAVSKGEYIVNLMNKVGYDAIALGNHELTINLRVYRS